MSGKFLHAFADENPELQKQIGCMTGIFQMFDRHHFLTGRRLRGHNHKRFASGHALQNSGNTRADRSTCSPQIVLEKNHSKSSNENQQASMESSRTSFSSSSSSSFSSLECNRSIQQEPLSLDRTFLENPTKNSPRLKHSDINSRPVQFGPLSDPPHASAQRDRRSLDFQDVVKDSIYRETRGLSIKTSKREEVKNHKLKHRDSPRPMLLSESVHGSYVIGVDEKSRLSADLNESLRVLVKLQEAPWYFSEASEPPRSSHEANDTSFFPVSREAPRFSYDGREISRSSLDSQDVSKPASKLRELPRLSLDSREGSLRSSYFGFKPHTILKDSDTSSINQGVPTPNFQQEWGGHKRPTSVVAKLMGLEAMPHLGLASQKPADLTETYASKDKDPLNGQRNRNLITKASRGSQDSRKDHLLHSPKSSLKDPAMQQLKKSDPVIKPVSNARLPIETAPWRQQERIQIPKKTTFGHRGAQLKQHPESFYSDIEKKLKELDFQQSNKDFRALKQIFDAMQAKGLLETNKSEDQHLSVCKNYSDQPPTGNDQNFRSTDARNPHNTPSVPTFMKGSNTPRAFESPIVIMKPAKSVSKSSVSSSSVIPLESLSGLRKLHTSDSMHRKKTSTNNRMAKEQTPKASTREYKKSTNRTEEISIQKTHLQMEQCSYRHQHSPRENSGSSVKTSGSLSPRLQQRKIETEKKSRLPIPSSESNKPRRNSTNRQTLESVSPRGRLRQRPAQAQQNDDQLSDVSSGTRSLSHPGDEISLRSEMNKSLVSQDDIEVTSADSAEMGLRCLQQGSWSPSRRAANSTSSVIKQKVRASQMSSCSLNEDVSAVELATVAPEHPSPISVLDASFYQDDMPPSPVSKAPSVFKGDEIDPSEHRWSPKPLPDSSSPNSGSKVNHKKLENIKNLVQKLRQLSSTDDEVPATDHIALLCETQSPDHRYVSEILLASGLLMKDINCGTMGPMPIQLHPSGHPINPDLFLVLEQTKSSMVTKLNGIHENAPRPKPEREKIHRKLLFDVVNELLIQKLELTSPGAQPYLMLRARKLAGRFPSGQQLLRELCSEVEQLKADTSIRDCCNDDTNLISGQDVLRQSKGWYEFSTEVPDMVLEIERLIFKDLIDEVVSGEGASGVQTKASRWRRQLFPK